MEGSKCTHVVAKAQRKQRVTADLTAIEIWVGKSSVGAPLRYRPKCSGEENQGVMGRVALWSNGQEIRTKPYYAALLRPASVRAYSRVLPGTRCTRPSCCSTAIRNPAVFTLLPLNNARNRTEVICVCPLQTP